MTDLSRADDPAVWAPIHRIAGTLDKALPELFASDYDQQLEAARQRLRPEVTERSGLLTIAKRALGHLRGPRAPRWQARALPDPYADNTTTLVARIG
ncbi:hypothetical protein ACIOGW_36130 [Streptomyces anulatus]